VDFGWDDNGLVTSVTVSGRSASVNIVNVEGTVLVST